MTSRPSPARRILHHLASGAWVGFACTGILLASAPPPANANPPPGETTVYLTKRDALATVFPHAERVVERKLLLSDEQIAAIEELGRQELTEGGFYLYGAFAGGVPVGYAVIVSQIGKVRPITHIVGVTPAGEVGRVAVMIYRESHGSEIVAPRFTAQFRGKTLHDPIRVGRDVLAVAGATLSAHAVCRGVRKALAVVQALVLDRTGAEREALWDAGSDVTPGPPRSPASGTTGDGTPTAPAGQDGPATAGVTLERQVMGTICRVQVLDSGPTGELRAAAEAALREVARWDDILSDWKDSTPLARLNRAPAGVAQEVPPELLAWLADSAVWARASGGAFDPAVGALVHAWGLNTPTPARPGERQLREAREASGLRLLHIDRVAGRVTRRVAGVTLDPGASGKGWALDRAAEVLRGRGVQRALLSFRSTVLALGPPAGREAWSVPVVHDGDGSQVTVVQLSRQALSVSCGALHAFDDNGVERGHVLDPTTGIPVPSSRLAWVTHPSAAAADALSTALLVLGPPLPAVEGAAGGFLQAPGKPAQIWPRSNSSQRSRP